MNIGGITSQKSRALHVIPDGDPDGDPDAGTATAACGASVLPRRYELRPAHEVCKKCRRAMGWPFIVTWTSKAGTVHTTDFN